MTVRWALVIVALTGLFGACGSRSGDQPSVVDVTGAVIGEARQGMNAAAYGRIIQRGGDDSIRAITASVTDRVTLMSAGQAMDAGGSSASLPIPLAEDATIALRPGGEHLMLERITDDLTAGDTVRLTFVFDRARQLSVDVPVVAVAELVDLVDPAGS